MFKKISFLLSVVIFSSNLYGVHIKKSTLQLDNDMNDAKYSYFSSVPVLKYDKFEIIGDNGEIYGSATILKNPNYDEWKKNDPLTDPVNSWGKKRNTLYDNRCKRPFYILNEITTKSNAPRGYGKSLLLAILNYYSNSWIGLTAYPHGEKAMPLNNLVSFYEKYGFRSLNSVDKSITGNNMRMCMFIGRTGVNYLGDKKNLLNLKIRH